MRENFTTLIDDIERGRIDTRPWTTHRLDLTSLPQNVSELSQQPGLIKAMISTDDAL